jgi:hypothetical protein
MQRELQEGITLEQKLRYLKEVENIYRLSKKTRPPKGKSWASIADSRLRHVMRLPIRESAGQTLTVRPGKRHHEHSPRSARILERTLKNGVVPPGILHSYREGVGTGGRIKDRPEPEPLRQDELPVQHFVQHSDSDLPYPHGHLQGFGFVPREHTVNSHIRLQTGGATPDAQVVPSKVGQAAGDHYH